jgi:hypothetical protein
MVEEKRKEEGRGNRREVPPEANLKYAHLEFKEMLIHHSTMVLSIILDNLGLTVWLKR